MNIDNEAKRTFYLEETIKSNWSVRQLERQINSFYYERLLSTSKEHKEEVKNEINLLEKKEKVQDFIKDPYVLEFLDIKDRRFLEKDLESNLLEHISEFLLELGRGFSFVARQKRIDVDGDNFYIDLVFYNFVLKCFVLIDLKLDKLTHQDIGQMDFYVRYYDNEIKAEDDNPTIGIILCSDKKDTIVKYSVLNDNKNLFASKYQLYLPTEEELAREIQKQKEEFEVFNGPILMTTNCIVPPKDSYKNRIYTTGAVRYPGCPHIDGVIGETKDFSLLIEQAKHCAPPTELEQGTIVGGFAHAQVLALADQIVDAVKSGAIKKFVVMAGCDGRAKSRSYYSDFAQALPKDTVILTAGCAKYKYNKLSLGDINGIPRVLDAGQCNDSYSLAVIALKLKEVFGLDDINDLPIIYNISWYEQKAVIVLLALLSLGVKNIHLGPTLPAFLSPNVAALLVENFGIAGIDTVENDMELFFGK